MRRTHNRSHLRPPMAGSSNALSAGVGFTPCPATSCRPPMTPISDRSAVKVVPAPDSASLGVIPATTVSVPAGQPTTDHSHEERINNTQAATSMPQRKCLRLNTQALPTHSFPGKFQHNPCGARSTSSLASPMTRSVNPMNSKKRLESKFPFRPIPGATTCLPTLRQNTPASGKKPRNNKRYGCSFFKKKHPC